MAYYQQVGRAGRALESAYGVLLSGQEDTDIIDYFIETAFPTREEAEQVLNALEEEVNGLSVFGLMERLRSLPFFPSSATSCHPILRVLRGQHEITLLSADDLHWNRK